MTTVRQLLRGKGQSVYTIGPDAAVYDALQEMAARDVGALVVTENGDVVGVVSERDYARKLALMGKISKETQVREIMSDEVVCVGPKQTVDGCMALMSEKRVRHLPVLENERLAGIISIGDVVKAIIEGQQSTIEELEHYITGRR
jgi:CBS domain-containing protein